MDRPPKERTERFDGPVAADVMGQGVFAMILAGGRGARLGGLTDRCAKPALPIAGTLRVIDFTLANCLNSGIRELAVLTQYCGQSLLRHLQAYRSDPRAARFEAVPAQHKAGGTCYQGTADAVYQNLDLVRESGVRWVLVLAGDHVYRMDYRAMLSEHLRRGARATVACIEVPREDARGFGVMAVGAGDRVTAFIEKPSDPPGRAGREHVALVSMGLYLFDVDLLTEVLARDARDPGSVHDFGRDLLPRLARDGLLHAHDFGASAVTPDGDEPYWRDVGTIDAYWRTQMDFLHGGAAFDPHDRRWPVSGAPAPMRPTRFDESAPCQIRQSIVAPGCSLASADIQRSVIGAGTTIGPGCEVHDSVLLADVTLGACVSLRRTVVDAGCRLPVGLRVGFDLELDASRFHVDKSGVTLVTTAMLERLPTRLAPTIRAAPALAAG